MKKGIVWVLICCVLMACLTGCGGSKANSATESVVSSATATPKPTSTPTATPKPTPTATPTPSPTPSPTPVPIAVPEPAELSETDAASLKAFLETFGCYGIYRTYDWRDVLADNGSEYGVMTGIKGMQPSKNIMDGVLCFPWCCDFDLYPGDISKSDLRISDAPLTFSGSEIDWILTNIFNCSKDDILAMRSQLTGRFSYDGDYHDSEAPLGFGITSAVRDVTDVKKYKNYFFVTYEVVTVDPPYVLFSHEQQAVMELKEINGEKYWSLYYSNISPFFGELPNGAIVEEGTLPVSTRTPEPEPTPEPTSEPTPVPTAAPVPGDNDFPVTLSEARQIVKNYITENHPDGDVQIEEHGGYAEINGKDFWGFSTAINVDGHWVMSRIFVNAQTGEIEFY